MSAESNGLGSDPGRHRPPPPPVVNLLRRIAAGDSQAQRANGAAGDDGGGPADHGAFRAFAMAFRDPFADQRARNLSKHMFLRRIEYGI